MTRAPEIVARRIGREGEPLVTVDGFHPDPDALRRAAAGATFGPGGHHYPGVRARVPGDYVASVRPVLATVLREAFGFGAAMRVLDAGFSIVTTPPAELTTEQRLPHVDATGADRIALIHYLSPDGGDGTAFYRHRATGFESVTDARAPSYYAALNREVASAPPPPSYLNGDTPLFEQVARGEARYNRAYLYRSRLLHSGAIAADAALSPDPLAGRLTVTLFLSAR